MKLSLTAQGVCALPILEYTANEFNLLEQARDDIAERLTPDSNLLHAPFVNYYYATRRWCKLYLAVSDAGRLEGTLGMDSLRFQSVDQEYSVGLVSNYMSLRNVGAGVLTRKALRNNKLIMQCDATISSHRIVDKMQHHVVWPGVRTYFFNKPYIPVPGEAKWRVAAKYLLRHVDRHRLSSRMPRLPADIGSRITIREESGYTEDLLPKNSPFGFRFAPPLEYLEWRYSLNLSFVRYRLFRIVYDGRTTGYVILNDRPERIIVSACDAEDPQVLAYAVLKCLLSVTNNDVSYRTVALTSRHTEMARIFEKCGFSATREDRRLAMLSWWGPFEPPPEQPEWLVNYELGDIGLRPPFLNRNGG